MKRNFFLLSFFLLFIGFSAFAGPELGGEISYKRLTKYSYLVKYTHYRDCQGTPLASTIKLNVKSPGCNSGYDVPLNQQSRKLGKPYGAATPPSCPGAATPLYEIVTYSGVVNFSLADAKCRNLVLSVSLTDRTEAENLVANAANTGYYTEALLQLTNTINSSPVFDTLRTQLMYVNLGTDYKFSMAAKDPDGDSLVYSLVAPLQNANSPVTYKTWSTGPGLPPNFIINPNPRPPFSTPFNPQIAQIQGSFYSATAPVFSIRIDWNGPPTVPYPAAPNNGMIWAANPYFVLNRANGDLSFAALSYNPNLQNLPGVNKYLVSILVEEFRKINGVATKIGSVRRETLIQVFDKNPLLDPVLVSNGNINNQRGSNVTTTPEPLQKQLFTAFPNPFSDELNFNLDLTTKAENIVIYDLLGQKVDVISLKTLGLGAQKVKWQNAGKHAAGAYIARLISADKTVQTLKFTKVQ